MLRLFRWLREWWQDRKLRAFIWDEVVSCPLQLATGIWGMQHNKASGKWIAAAGRNTLVCPMGAVLLGTELRTGDMYTDVAEVLGMPELWVSGFIDGFDDGDRQRDFADVARERLYTRGFAVGVFIHQQAVRVGLLRKEGA